MTETMGTEFIKTPVDYQSNSSPTGRLVPIMLIFCLLFYSIILQQALIIPKRFAYFSQQETYYSDPNRHCYGKIVHDTPTLTFLAA